MILILMQKEMAVLTLEGAELSRHVADFKENGYTVFEQLFDQDQISIWRDRFPQLRKELYGNMEKEHYVITNMVERYPTFMLPLTANSTILDFLESIMGPHIQIGDCNFNGFPPVSKEKAANKVNGWHRDMYAFVPNGTDYQIPRQVLALAYLEDMTEETGPLRVIPGTHRKDTEIATEDRDKPHPDEQLLALKSGDVIVFSGLLHSGSYNTSDKFRLLLGGMYTYSWYRPNCNFNGPNVQRLIREATERNDRRMLRLLGVHGDLERGRANSGFRIKDEARWREWIAEDKAALKGEPDWWKTPLGN